jgi:hypothetical protein
MKKLSLVMVMVLLIGAAGQQARADETYRPRYQFKENQKFTYDLMLTYAWDPVVVISDNREPAGQIEAEMTNRYHTQFVQKILGVEDGRTTFEIMYVLLKYISEKGKEDYIPGTKAVKKRKLVYTIEADGRLKLVEAWKPFSPLPGGIHFAAELKDNLFKLYPEFPAEDLTVGSTWSCEIKGSDFDSNDNLSLDYRVAGFEKYLNHRCMKIEVKGTLKADYRLDDPLGEYFAQVNHQGGFEGICYFSHIKGLLVGFTGRTDRNTVVSIEWVRGNQTGRKQVKETKTGIEFDLKLLPGGSK